MNIKEENDTEKSIHIIAIIILSFLVVFVIGPFFKTNYYESITRKYYEYNNYKFDCDENGKASKWKLIIIFKEIQSNEINRRYYIS